MISGVQASNPTYSPISVGSAAPVPVQYSILPNGAGEGAIRPYGRNADRRQINQSRVLLPHESIGEHFENFKAKAKASKLASPARVDRSGIYAAEAGGAAIVLSAGVLAAIGIAGRFGSRSGHAKAETPHLAAR